VSFTPLVESWNHPIPQICPTALPPKAILYFSREQRLYSLNILTPPRIYWAHCLLSILRLDANPFQQCRFERRCSVTTLRTTKSILSREVTNWFCAAVGRTVCTGRVPVKSVNETMRTRSNWKIYTSSEQNQAILTQNQLKITQCRKTSGSAWNA